MYSKMNNSVLRLLKYSVILSLLVFGKGYAQTQSWVPDSKGILETYQLPYTNQPAPYAFNIKFKTNGPFGKDYIYGHWLDSDSIFRCVATREGGRWVPLPFHVNSFSWTGDIIQYGDTMYVGGWFDDVVRDKDSASLPSTTLLKVFGDSVWEHQGGYFGFVFDMATSGDSLLVNTSSYVNSTDTMLSHALKSGKNSNWEYPFSIIHPTETVAYFGAQRRVEFWKGDIITINNISSGPYGGIARWDGQQWHSFGDGVRGGFPSTFDFTFFRDELYMSGSFTKQESPLNPGEFIARWDGVKWNEVGGGLNTGVRRLFVYDDLLYCHAVQSGYGDANIPYLAAWDGVQWCGTIMNNIGGDPPRSFGFVNDTLWVMFSYLITTINGDSVGYLNYFDGDYVKGPNSICSTPGLGLEESAQKPAIQVYPNPAKDVLNVVLPDGNETYSYELYSMDGRLLQQGKLDATHNQIKVAKGLSGLCVLKLTGEREVVSLKVAVER